MATEFLAHQVRFGTKEFMATKLDNMALEKGTRAATQSTQLRRWGRDTIRATEELAVPFHNAHLRAMNADDVARRRELRKYDERAWMTGELGNAQQQTAVENPRDHYLFGGPNPHMQNPAPILSVENKFQPPNRKPWNAYSQRGEHYKGDPELQVFNVSTMQTEHPRGKQYK